MYWTVDTVQNTGWWVVGVRKGDYVKFTLQLSVVRQSK